MLIANNILNYSFIITGSSGWIGRALIEKLYLYFGPDIQNKVIAFSQSSSHITLQDGFKLRTCNYNDQIEYSKDSILCHFAFLTMDKVSIMTNEEHEKKNLIIRQDVVKIIKNAKPKSILLSSSGAIYKEDNLYGKLKLKDEVFFTKLAKENNVKILIPRIFNIGGPYINKHSLYALSDFIMQLIKSGQIVIKAPHTVIRSYIHISDLLDICLNWLLDENKNKSLIFDTKNKKDVDLIELAHLIIKNLDIKGEIITSPSFSQHNKADKYVGDPEQIDNLVQKYTICLKGYGDIINDTYRYLIKNYE